MYSEPLEDLGFENMDAWKSTPTVLGLHLVLLKHKKNCGNFKATKVRITIEELPTKKERR